MKGLRDRQPTGGGIGRESANNSGWCGEVVTPADLRIRLAAFDWLKDQVGVHGDVLPRDVLARGFIWNEQRVPLPGPQGIFKPKVLTEIPLSITTAPKGPYDDHFGPEELLRYAYRGTNPQHHAQG